MLPWFSASAAVNLRWWGATGGSKTLRPEGGVRPRTPVFGCGSSVGRGVQGVPLGFCAYGGLEE